MLTFIFDLDGTLYRGETVLPGAREVVTALRAQGHHVTFATNNSTRTRSEYDALLGVMGFAVEEDGLATSAYSTALYLAALPEPPRSVFVLGSPALEEEIAACLPGVRFDGAAPIDAVVVGLDRALTYDRLASAQHAVLRGAHFVASNRDLVYPAADRLYPGSGSIVAALEAATGVTATTIGKPAPYMYSQIMSAAGATPATTVMVGDNLRTDIAAAAVLGLYSVLVLTGVDGVPDKDDASVPRPALVLPSVADLLSIDWSILLTPR